MGIILMHISYLKDMTLSSNITFLCNLLVTMTVLKIDLVEYVIVVNHLIHELTVTIQLYIVI